MFVLQVLGTEIPCTDRSPSPAIPNSGRQTIFALILFVCFGKCSSIQPLHSQFMNSDLEMSRSWERSATLWQWVLPFPCFPPTNKNFLPWSHDVISAVFLQAANGVGAKTNNLLLVINEYRGLSWRYDKLKYTFVLILIVWENINNCI